MTGRKKTGKKKELPPITEPTTDLSKAIIDLTQVLAPTFESINDGLTNIADTTQSLKEINEISGTTYQIEDERGKVLDNNNLYAEKSYRLCVFTLITPYIRPDHEDDFEDVGGERFLSDRPFEKGCYSFRFTPRFYRGFLSHDTAISIKLRGDEKTLKKISIRIRRPRWVYFLIKKIAPIVGLISFIITLIKIFFPSFPKV